MDVINISGLKFRIRADATVFHVLDVFRVSGRKGILQRNGIVEYIDSPLEFNTSSPYVFVETSELLETDSVSSSRNQSQKDPLKPINISQISASNDTQTDSALNPNTISPCILPQKLDTFEGTAETPSVPTPQLYKTIELKARENRYLNVNEIAVYNKLGQNVAMSAVLESSEALLGENGVSYTATKALNGEIRDVHNSYKSAHKGGWIRLTFDKHEHITQVALRNLQTINHPLMGATLQVKDVCEYLLNADFKYLTIKNSVPFFKVNAIEIKAPIDDFLQLSQIRIVDNNGRTVQPMFKSVDLASTMQFVTAEEVLFGSVNSKNDDYVRSVHRGGFIRLTFSEPIYVHFVALSGVIHRVKVTMEREYSYLCSDEPLQNFFL